MRWAGIIAGLTFLPLGVAGKPPADAVERGKKALLGRAFNPTAFTFKSYDDAWQRWGLKEKPADYDRLFREHYGLHEAPYPNGKYPMGLREATGLILGKGLTTDCLTCHGGSIAGQSYVGLPNTTVDYQALYEDLAALSGFSRPLPFQFTRVRGTTEAGAMGVFLLGTREPDLSARFKRLELGLRDDLCEDAPAWWLLKKKTTMYQTGSHDARSVRSLMQFMLALENTRGVFDRQEATFRDIQAYLLSLEPPKYVFAIDRDGAAKGEKLFRRDCLRCHGTYGERPTYPNRIVPLEEIGTDPARYHGIGKAFHDYYNQTWFSQEQTAKGGGCKSGQKGGYQAPPLDGIWATAPYFHNGSAPTVYHVLNSKARPTIFTRSFRTGKEDYDPVKLGWKVTVLEKGPDPSLPVIERRKVYDTTQPGRGNGGHTFGDKLSDEERFAIIEYLKTL
jgi:hypothetical protein